MPGYRLLFAFLLAAAVGAGCYTGGDVAPLSGGATAPRTAVDGTETSPASVTGLPCDVAQILASSCVTCHGAVPTSGAPNAMVTYEDLVAPSKTDAPRTVAEVSVARMHATKEPMPPSGGVAADAAVLAAWVAGGMRSGTCDTPIAAGPDGTYDTPSVCTSNRRWTRGNHGSSSMRPGGACIQCHDSDEGPSYAAAGTVYPTAHEPDDCNGVGGAQVVLTDATGKVFTAAVNAAGNFAFSARSSIRMPYTAKVVSGSKTRAMAGAQTDGDCNGCHGEAGANKAPGRIMAP